MIIIIGNSNLICPLMDQRSFFSFQPYNSSPSILVFVAWVKHERVRKRRQLTWLCFSNVCTTLLMQCGERTVCFISSIVKESLSICLHMWNNVWTVLNRWKSMQCRMKEHECFSNTPQHKKVSLHDSNKVSDLTWGHLTVSWMFSDFLLLFFIDNF